MSSQNLSFPRVREKELVKIQRLLEVLFCINCKHWLGNIRQASQNTGFADALGFMKLGAALELEDGAGDGSSTVTPACKKPRLSDQIAAGLIITPPPTLTERQSVSCFCLLEIWIGVSNTTF